MVIAAVVIAAAAVEDTRAAEAPNPAADAEEDIREAAARNLVADVEAVIPAAAPSSVEAVEVAIEAAIVERLVGEGRSLAFRSRWFSGESQFFPSPVGSAC